MQYNYEQEWTNYFLNFEAAYPAETLIRILKGNYPNLKIDKNYKDKKVMDLGCGCGRNMIFLYSLGFDIFGVDLTQDIIDKTAENLKKQNVKNFDLRIGRSDNLPFREDELDYIVSWGTSFYIGESLNFDKYILEFTRTLKKDGCLIMDLPQKTHCLYNEMQPYQKGYCINKKSGEILKIFRNKEEIINKLSPYFYDIAICTNILDCFGKSYDSYSIVCKRK